MNERKTRCKQSRRAKSKAEAGWAEAQEPAHQCWQEREATQRKSCLKLVSTSEVLEDASPLKTQYRKELKHERLKSSCAVGRVLCAPKHT